VVVPLQDAEKGSMGGSSESSLNMNQSRKMPQQTFLFSTNILRAAGQHLKDTHKAAHLFCAGVKVN
jgi:hypothetical protein